MKKTAIQFLFMLVAIVPATAQTWAWARQSSGTTASQYGYKVKSIATGGCYVSGVNEGLAAFGPYTLNPGSFLAKYDASGNALWALNIEGVIRKVETDNYGNACVFGLYSGSLTIGGTSVASNGGDDLFAAKFDPLGNLLWLRSYGGNENESAGDMIVDQYDNLYITGSYRNAITFDSFSLTDTSAFIYRFFLTKLNTAGNVLWTDEGHWNSRMGRFLAFDASFNVYVQAIHQENCMYCEGTFLAKYTPAGSMYFYDEEWDVFEDSKGLGVDAAGNIYTIYNTGSHYTDEPTLQKYDASLNPLWSVCLGDGYTCGYWIGNGLKVDAAGNSYVIGGANSLYPYGDSANFAGQWIHVQGITDIIMAKINTSGSFSWVQVVQGTGGEIAGGVDVDPAGNCYLTGVFNAEDSTMTDAVPFGPDTLHNEGTWRQFYLAKFIPGTVAAGVNSMAVENMPEPFPNPAHDVFTISLPGSAVSRICVYDLLGNCIRSLETDAPGVQIDLGGEAKGVYFVEVDNANGKFSKKIILD